MYLAMETTDLEFEFFLAEQLGMTVARLRQEVSNSELMAWGVYYGRKTQREQLATKRGR